MPQPRQPEGLTVKQTTRFFPVDRRLEILLRSSQELPGILLKTLRDEQFLSDIRVSERRRGQALILILTEHDGLLPLNLLERLAYRLSCLPGYLGVRDPWTISDEHVNVPLAIELVGDVFRDFANRQTAVR